MRTEADPIGPVGIDAAPPRPAAGPAAVASALRVHQWVKNLLVLVPVVASHRLGDAGALGASLQAFLAFSLVASGVYVVNDLVDREADRQHPGKRRRPIASGAIPARAGAGLAAASLLGGAALAAGLPARFLLVLLGYVAVTTAYSLWLKRLVMVDVLVLAGLYTSRIVAGSAATGVPISEWLASFSMFLFFSLALLKRASELVHVGVDPPGRGYLLGDREQVFTLGAASGYVAVLVLALYVRSDAVRLLYAHPERLWLLVPLLLYWTSRLWIQARRGQVHDDPVVHAIRDRGSWAVAALAAVVVAVAT